MPLGESQPRWLTLTLTLTLTPTRTLTLTLTLILTLTLTLTFTPTLTKPAAGESQPRRAACRVARCAGLGGQCAVRCVWEGSASGG